MVIYRRKIRLTKCLITHLLLRIRKTLNCSYRLLIRTSLRAVSWVLIYFKIERKKYVFPTELPKNYQQNIKQERQKVYILRYIFYIDLISRPKLASRGILVSGLFSDAGRTWGVCEWGGLQEGFEGVCAGYLYGRGPGRWYHVFGERGNVWPVFLSHHSSKIKGWVSCIRVSMIRRFAFFSN